MTLSIVKGYISPFGERRRQRILSALIKKVAGQFFSGATEKVGTIAPTPPTWLLKNLQRQRPIDFTFLDQIFSS